MTVASALVAFLAYALLSKEKYLLQQQKRKQAYPNECYQPSWGSHHQPFEYRIQWLVEYGKYPKQISFKIKISYVLTGDTLANNLGVLVNPNTGSAASTSQGVANTRNLRNTGKHLIYYNFCSPTIQSGFYVSLNWQKPDSVAR